MKINPLGSRVVLAVPAFEPLPKQAKKEGEVKLKKLQTTTILELGPDVVGFKIGEVVSFEEYGFFEKKADDFSYLIGDYKHIESKPDLTPSSNDEDSK